MNNTDNGIPACERPDAPQENGLPKQEPGGRHLDRLIERPAPEPPSWLKERVMAAARERLESSVSSIEEISASDRGLRTSCKRPGRLLRRGSWAAAAVLVFGLFAWYLSRTDYHVVQPPEPVVSGETSAGIPTSDPLLEELDSRLEGARARLTWLQSPSGGDAWELSDSENSYRFGQLLHQARSVREEHERDMESMEDRLDSSIRPFWKDQIQAEVT